jgi:hypothetical protein
MGLRLPLYDSEMKGFLVQPIVQPSSHNSQVRITCLTPCVPICIYSVDNLSSSFPFAKDLSLQGELAALPDKYLKAETHQSSPSFLFMARLKVNDES